MGSGLKGTGVSRFEQDVVDRDLGEEKGKGVVFRDLV
ncbi:hypothetical protein CA13_73780 [Planctomycetes bacterium CA13]|uniref:Uncharacterized protein n=1 Tax=Novipirellula herctigrandis TaxID=2527986 RepID=A0A5C5YLL3_9BACT|nr:hypothetical protein CA13_73780 [Planctomycetes bacterium CA13]